MKSTLLKSEQIAELSQSNTLQGDLLRLIREGSERCTLCRKPFGHNALTYACVVDSGEIAIIGDCCADRMKKVCGIGVTARRAGYEGPLDA
jgi:hypothetical protein